MKRIHNYLVGPGSFRKKEHLRTAPTFKDGHQPRVTVTKHMNGNVEYESVKFLFANGKEIEIHAHAHYSDENYHGQPDPKEQLWISGNGPIHFRPHCSNGASVGIDYVYPPMP